MQLKLTVLRSCVALNSCILQCRKCQLVMVISRNMSVDKRGLKMQSSGPRNIKRDWIGPADPVSNIRPHRFYEPINESTAQRTYREYREETQRFHQTYWSKHNRNFTKSKEKFISEKLAELQRKNPDGSVKKLTPEQLSDFYREFLDNHYKMHRQYNRDWYMRNIKLVWLALRAKLGEKLGSG